MYFICFILPIDWLYCRKQTGKLNVEFYDLMQFHCTIFYCHSFTWFLCHFLAWQGNLFKCFARRLL